MKRFEKNRGERRSFYCPNQLWTIMKRELKDTYSISEFIKHAIRAKLRKDFDREDLKDEEEEE